MVSLSGQCRLSVLGSNLCTKEHCSSVRSEPGKPELPRWGSYNRNNKNIKINLYVSD